MASNKFRKALRHLKSTELDEKILSLNEAPTNSMGGVYALNQPGHRLGPQDPAKVFYPDVDGNWPSGIPGTPGERMYIRPAGYWETGPGSVPSIDWDFQVDLSHSDTSTDGFIDSSTGQVLVPLPPNSDHFILGPLVDGYTYNHGYDDFTTIGYIQKDTRQLVVLATIPGYWKSGESGIRGSGVTNREWDGSTINIVNPSFTLEMAEWFRDRYNEGKYVNKVSYFYSGGQPQAGNSDTGAPAGTKGGVVPGVGDGSVVSASGPQGTGTSNGDPRIGTQQNAANHGGPEDAELYYTQQDPKVFANMTAGELAELGLNLLNIGLDIAAIAGIIFPEPGTSAAGLARLATRLGQRAGSRAMNSARNRALRGALNPLGQRAVRSGAAGRKRVPVYSGRPYRGKRGFGKTTYGTTDPKTAASYSNPGPLKGTTGTGSRVNPKGTIDKGTLPQRYIDKYGSRSVLGQRQIKLGQKAAKRTFGEQFLLEVATATPTVTTAPTQEQITKTNQTADQTADVIANSISQDQAADLAVKAEGDAILLAANDPAVQEALDRATKYGPQSLTAEQKQILINNGYDDFVRGGMQGTDWLGDLLTLGLSAAAVYILWPVLLKLGGSIVGLVRTEHGMRALTDAAYKTFQTTGQMPPWYHWAFWKLLPQPMLNAFARIAGTVPAKSLLATEGTAAGKIGLHYILKPAALTSFFQLLIKGDQRGAEKLLETSITDAVKQDIESENYDLLMAMWDSVGEDTFLKLTDVYGDQKEGFNEKNDRLEELYDPEYIKGIQNEIKEFENQYNFEYKKGSDGKYKKVLVGPKNWGGQFTKEMFESSEQDFGEYEALRSQIGFFNNETGPNKYGQYQQLGYQKIMHARKNGHKPEQFTGIAYEIVSRSYKMDEIMKNPNYPRQGRNIYNNEADYLEASKLQDEYQKILGEYINLWEGPGGYEDLSKQAWNFYTVSTQRYAEKRDQARKQYVELESKLSNIEKEREELADEVFELYDEIYTEMLVDYLLEPPETKYPTDVSYNPQQNNQEIAGLRPDGTQGQNKVGDTNRGHDGTLYKLVPRPGYGYNMWVPVKHAKKDDPNTPLGTTDPTTLATTGYATRKRKKKNDEEELFASYKNSGVVLSEERKRILREIKQPYKLPEQPKQKYKMNFKGKFTAQNTPDVTASKQSDAILTAKNSAGQTWRAQDKHWSRYESTERMNIIYDNIGHGSQYFDMIVNENQGKKGWRNREIQEQLNLISHHAYEKSMEQIIEQQTLDAPNDPLFKKVADKLRKQIDYPDKPAKAGYPNNPPPEMVNGKHPEYGQKSDYYKRLDPHSAEAMPPTGNPKIDTNIQKSVDMKRKVRKLKNIIGKRG